MTDTGAELEVEGAVLTAVGEALLLFGVHQLAALAPPPLPAHAAARHAVAVPATQRVRAVNCNPIQVRLGVWVPRIQRPKISQNFKL